MKYNILVVEDERIERESTVLSIQLHLSSTHTIRSAENGIEALEKFATETPDLVIMDIDLPGYSGIETIVKMQELSSKTQYIILSAYKMFDYAQAALKLGVVEYLLKPCCTNDLITAIRNAQEQVDKDNSTHSLPKNQSTRMDEIRPVLEGDCVFALASMRTGEQLKERFQILQEHPGEGVAFVVNCAIAQRKVLTTVKKGLQRMDVYCIGEALNGHCVFVILGNVANDEEKLRHIAEYVSNLLCQIDVSCNLGMGCTSTHVDQMRESYGQALKALSQAAMESKPYVVYSTPADEEKADELSVKEIGKNLLYHIKTQNQEGITQTVQSLLGQWIAEKSTRNQVDNGMYRLWLFIAGSLPETVTDALLEEFTLQKIRYYPDLPMLCQDFIQLMIQVSTLMFEEQTPYKTGNQLIHQAISIIHKQYMDNITLNQVALTLSITPFYLSKLMKKQTGKTFTDYLTAFRIERAKELLEEDRLSIKEVTYAVGFNSQNYFAKVFKKHTTLSPSEYKSMVYLRPS